jgi:hypothetical protein
MYLHWRLSDLEGMQAIGVTSVRTGASIFFLPSFHPSKTYAGLAACFLYNIGLTFVHRYTTQSFLLT